MGEESLHEQAGGCGKLSVGAKMTLQAAHKGYEYQDLVCAIRSIDLVLGETSRMLVDRKLGDGDRFDDLTIESGKLRERMQIKHTDKLDRPIDVTSFSNDSRSMALSRLVESIILDRDGPGQASPQTSFRILTRDTKPVDPWLSTVLSPATPDPGAWQRGDRTTRLTFDADLLLSPGSEPTTASARSIVRDLKKLDANDVRWALERLIVEVDSPVASLDLLRPGPAEEILLRRVTDELGAGLFPNGHREPVDVAMMMIAAMRTARQQGAQLDEADLLRQTQLRRDFGAVARAHPVDERVEVQRPDLVNSISNIVESSAVAGRTVVIVAPPGQGKSWACQQVVTSLLRADWLVAEHYCFLGDADGDLFERVMIESLYGSLLARIEEQASAVVQQQRPRFAADSTAVEQAVALALDSRLTQRIAVVVDGLDHVTRVRRGGSFDPAIALSESLAALELAEGAVLVVLSQPGDHLSCFVETGAEVVQLEGLSRGEIAALSERLGVVGLFDPPAEVSSQSDEDRGPEALVSAIADKSRGNALYATYLLREVLRSPSISAAPGQLSGLPPFDGTLGNYYSHLLKSLGDAGWVADVLALVDFSISRDELRQINPSQAYRVDNALSVLSPVLLEQLTQGGVRAYHESFARFLRLGFESDKQTVDGLYDMVVGWLRQLGFFNDSRAFRFLAQTLAEAGRHEEVVELINRDFVIDSAVAGHPASAMTSNLGVAVRSAGVLGDWPAVLRCVQLSRAAETFQFERVGSTLVEFAEIPIELHGAQNFADRLLHDGRPVMEARDGLQLCAAADKAGAIAPWQEYLRAFEVEDERSNTSYGVESDLAVSLAWSRGRMRLSSMANRNTADTTADLLSGNLEANEHQRLGSSQHSYSEPIEWDAFADSLEAAPRAVPQAAEAILDTFGVEGIELVESLLPTSGEFCLAVAELLHERSLSIADWPDRAAVSCPPGSVHRLLNFGAVPDFLVSGRVPASELLALSEAVLSRSSWEDGRLLAWLDECVLAAAAHDHLALSAAEAVLTGEGWYPCWLRFMIGLARAESVESSERPEAAWVAISQLRDDLRPFAGSPRASDLYEIHGLVESSLVRALQAMDDRFWISAIDLLQEVGDQINTTFQGEVGGPLSTHVIVEAALATGTESRAAKLDTLLKQVREERSGGRFYSDIASLWLFAAQSAMRSGNRTATEEFWTESCRFLSAYGWRRDVTLWELLDGIEVIHEHDTEAARSRLAHLQPLVDRVLNHTDGKDTRGVLREWMKLLGLTDPRATALMLVEEMASECNSPMNLLESARADLWRSWARTSDPVLSALLRMSLEIGLDSEDANLVGRMASIADGTGCDPAGQLLSGLMCRHDESPVRHSSSNSNELLDRDQQLINACNTSAAAASSPASHPPMQVRSAEDRSYRAPSPAEAGPAPAPAKPGPAGIAQLIRWWALNSYKADRSDRDSYSAAIGYRLCELAQSGRQPEAAQYICALAATMKHRDTSGLLRSLGEGLSRLGYPALAARAMAFHWSRERSGGGWKTFGGTDQQGALLNAFALDEKTALAVLAEEVELVVRGELPSYGVTEALVRALAVVAPTATTLADDLYLQCWDEAHAVIATRLPWVDGSDDPEWIYSPKPATNLQDEANEGQAIAVFGGLAHAWTETKLRSLLAVELLLDEQPVLASVGLSHLLCHLQDPATLQWSMSLLEANQQPGDELNPALISVLRSLAQSPMLGVRVLAREIAPASTVFRNAGPSDPRLLEARGLERAGDPQNEPGATVQHQIDHTAGRRLTRLENHSPGSAAAVERIVAASIGDKLFRSRLNRQLRSFAGISSKRWPDAYLAADEVVETALQNVAASARAGIALSGQIQADANGYEALLGEIVIESPDLAVSLERSRFPRPGLQAAPQRTSDVWNGASITVEPGDSQVDSLAAGTVSMREPSSCFALSGAPLDGWRLIGTVEKRTFLSNSLTDTSPGFSLRYQCCELRGPDSELRLDHPPIFDGDARIWTTASSANYRPRLEGSQPLVGNDSTLVAFESVPRIFRPERLLVPGPALVQALGLDLERPFSFCDEAGSGLRLITWRTGFDVSDYHLPRPHLVGQAIALRADLFERLCDLCPGTLILRDFVAGIWEESDYRDPEANFKDRAST